MNQDSKPSWKRFEHFDGPAEEERTRALRAKREREGHGGNQFGTDLTNGTPRKTKYGRNTRIAGLHLR